ncbi:MAG: hypothetical protein HZB91_13425 [Elusimicrobia bacterium]|nr:hypothetical protein [Elusimicrobiota bacterium]
MTVDLVVETEGSFLGLWDLASPANKPGHYDQAWDAAWDFNRDPPGALSWKHEDMETALEGFDSYWSIRQTRGEILVWKTGSRVLKVGLRLLPPQPRKRFRKAQREAFVGLSGAEPVLACPSGRIVVSCLRSLGRPDLKTSVVVRPGEYRVGMDVDGPVFVIFLQK